MRSRLIHSEVVLVESPDHLKKSTDEETGLALIDVRDH